MPHVRPLRRRLLGVALTAIALAVGAFVGPGSAEAAVGDRCSERFPEVSWTTVSDGAITVEAAGLTDGLMDRFGGEIALVGDWITSDIGPFTATVCLISNESEFDTGRWTSGSSRFHARMEMDERLVALNIERIGFVGPAAAWSLAHHALWQNSPSDAHPEPIASVIGQWYRARLLDRIEQYYRDVMIENFFDTDAVIDWTEGEQAPTLMWDPEWNFQAIGTFVDFAVEQHGTSVLLETDGQRWSDIEGEWRMSLRSDLMGRTSPTTEWIGGVGIVVGVLLVTVVAIGLGLWSKHRRRERPSTPEAIPGLFSDS